MKKLTLSLAALCALGLTQAMAQEDAKLDGFYAGAGLSAVTLNYSDVSRDFFSIVDGQDRLGNVTLVAGYDVNEYVGVEGRYTFPLQDEDVIEMDSGWSLFVKPMYKFDGDDGRANGENYFAVYGLLGFGGVSFQGVNQVPGEVDETGFQWGLGLSYTIRRACDQEEYRYEDDWTLFADYTNLGNDMEGLFYEGYGKLDSEALTVGVSYHF
jgi:opacity protein-like surface antigen